MSQSRRRTIAMASQNPARSGPSSRSDYVHAAASALPPTILAQVLTDCPPSTNCGDSYGTVRHAEGVALPVDGKYALVVMTDMELLLFPLTDGNNTKSWATFLKSSKKQGCKPLFRFDLSDITDIRFERAPATSGFLSGEFNFEWTSGKREVPSASHWLVVSYSRAAYEDSKNVAMILVEQPSALNTKLCRAWNKALLHNAGGLDLQPNPSTPEASLTFISECLARLRTVDVEEQANVLKELEAEALLDSSLKRVFFRDHQVFFWLLATVDHVDFDLDECRSTRQHFLIFERLRCTLRTLAAFLTGSEGIPERLTALSTSTFGTETLVQIICQDFGAHRDRLALELTSGPARTRTVSGSSMWGDEDLLVATSMPKTSRLESTVDAGIEHESDREQKLPPQRQRPPKIEIPNMHWSLPADGLSPMSATPRGDTKHRQGSMVALCKDGRRFRLPSSHILNRSNTFTSCGPSGSTPRVSSPFIPEPNSPAIPPTGRKLERVRSGKLSNRHSAPSPRFAQCSPEPSSSQRLSQPKHVSLSGSPPKQIRHDVAKRYLDHRLSHTQLPTKVESTASPDRFERGALSAGDSSLRGSISTGDLPHLLAQAELEASRTSRGPSGIDGVDGSGETTRWPDQTDLHEEEPEPDWQLFRNVMEEILDTQIAVLALLNDVASDEPPQGWTSLEFQVKNSEVVYRCLNSRVYTQEVPCSLLETTVSSQKLQLGSVVHVTHLSDGLPMHGIVVGADADANTCDVRFNVGQQDVSVNVFAKVCSRIVDLVCQLGDGYDRALRRGDPHLLHPRRPPGRWWEDWNADRMYQFELRAGSRHLDAVLEDVDWLCGNEVALYRHSAMLLRILQAGPGPSVASSSPSLRARLMVECREELGMCFNDESFLRALLGAPNDSALRLNNATLRNLRAARRLLDEHHGRHRHPHAQSAVDST